MTTESQGNRKVLVVAGTHQRETKFSHPTADLIVSHYGGSASYPQEKIVGIDKAREAELWNFGKVAVAKIRKIGEPSIDYIKTLPFARLLYLAEFSVWNMSNGAEFAETFGKEHQGWTSVHDPVLEAIKPSFFFDLHSYHKCTEGMKGTGACIYSYARQEYNGLVTKALAAAKDNEPEVYGRPDADICPIDYEEIRGSLAQKYFGLEELMKILAVAPEDMSDNQCVKAFGKKLIDLKHKTKYRNPEEWGNQWYLHGDRYRTDEPDNFCFEAIHWGKEQQEATARFLTTYLAELL